jgi:hypothetical protein
MHLHDSSRTALRAPGRALCVASLATMLTSLFVLDGCQAIKGIFEAGFGVGVVVVIAIVAIIGGVIAMVSRK